jgi:hypothetical protein
MYLLFYRELASAKKIIQELKSISKDDKLALCKAEKRASDFEAWGRRTKTWVHLPVVLLRSVCLYTQDRHYQDIIKQMEANQPRSGSTARSSSYLREYLQELPTLRPVHPSNDLGYDEEYPFTPKKKRESAPIIMTPLRPSTSSYVGLTRSRQQPPKLEFDETVSFMAYRIRIVSDDDIPAGPRIQHIDDKMSHLD